MHSIPIDSVKLDGPCITPCSQDLLRQGGHRLEDRVLRLLHVTWRFSTPAPQTILIKHVSHLDAAESSCIAAMGLLRGSKSHVSEALCSLRCL